MKKLAMLFLYRRRTQINLRTFSSVMILTYLSMHIHLQKEGTLALPETTKSVTITNGGFEYLL